VIRSTNRNGGLEAAVHVTVEPVPVSLASNGMGAEPQRKAVKPCPGGGTCK
jgi:hypothetical protein